MAKNNKSITEGILFTDQYQLTMAQVYFRMGLHERRVQFDHFFRSYPNYGTHQAGYCVNAGLEWLLDWMDEARFRDEEIEYLRGQTGRGGRARIRRRFPGVAAAKTVISRGITCAPYPRGALFTPTCRSPW